jgi:predicted secreted acid phosphatase
MNHTYDIVRRASSYLSDLKLPEMPAMVFDIDDTLINSSNLPIVPVIQLFEYAKHLGITPFIVTNRMGNDGNDIYTSQQLYAHGIRGYKGIYFRDKECLDMWTPKICARRHIYEKGYNTVMSIGDKVWDIGEYGGVGVIVNADDVGPVL